MIDYELNNLLGNYIDNEIEFSDNDSQNEMAEDNGYEEYRYNWMHLVEMDPNVKINSQSDLRTCDMD